MIYFAQADGIGHIKIGFTDGEDALGRIDTLQTGSPVPIRLLGTIPGSMEDEKNLHRRFAGARVHGEWFQPIAELLGLIGAKPVECEGKTITERTVSIRVLTVGRKQFSKTLLEQLPQSDLLFDFFSLWNDISRHLNLKKCSPVAFGMEEAEEVKRVAAFASDFNLLEDTDYWGWAKDSNSRNAWKVPIFVRGARLCRHPPIAFYDNLAPSFAYPPNAPGAVKRVVTHVWDRNYSKWFANEHQLFIGV